MTRSDYIEMVESLRHGINRLISERKGFLDEKGGLTDAKLIEINRAQKTEKMMNDLAVRLYEDGAVSERIRNETYIRGGEQMEIDYAKGEEE